MKIKYIKLVIPILLCFAVIFKSQFALSQVKDSIKDICSCKPSLPLEITATSIIWGIPTYVIWRWTFLKNSSTTNGAGALVGPSLFLLMLSLGTTSEWTSDCEASWWHTLWIGLGTGFTSAIIYGAATNSFNHPGNLKTYKVNIPDYLALGLAPSIASVFIYNLLLHPKEKKDQSLYVIPTFGGKNTASLNFMMQF